MTKKIGLVGEDPNDTTALKHLLQQRFNSNVKYVQLVKNKRGYQLDSKGTKKLIKKECELQQPDIVIFMRDADGVFSQVDKREKCVNWYNNLKSVVNTNKILLINIYELEALIFADIETFNNLYRTSIKGDRNVTFIKEPKEVLIKHTYKNTKKYSEPDCPDIFKELNIDTVAKNCTYFKEFLDELTGMLPKQYLLTKS